MAADISLHIAFFRHILKVGLEDHWVVRYSWAFCVFCLCLEQESVPPPPPPTTKAPQCLNPVMHRRWPAESWRLQKWGCWSVNSCGAQRWNSGNILPCLRLCPAWELSLPTAPAPAAWRWLQADPFHRSSDGCRKSVSPMEGFGKGVFWVLHPIPMYRFSPTATSNS